MLLGAAPASADAIFDLIFSGTTGSGLIGGSSIDAEVGDVLDLDLYMTAGPSGVEGYSVSIDYSGGGAATVNDSWFFIGGSPFNVPLDTGTLDPVLDTMLSAAEGCFLCPNGGLLDGQTHYIGTLEFEVTASGTATPNITGNPGVDGVSGIGGFDIGGTSVFNAATWTVGAAVPEPAVATLIGLGILGLTLHRCRARR